MKEDKDAALRNRKKFPGRSKEKTLKNHQGPENDTAAIQQKEEKGLKHPEAFKIVTYECTTCGFRESIWNSRDGAPIFFVDCQKCGREGQRIRREEDLLVIDYKPKRGERIIQDITHDKARDIANLKVDMLRGTPDEIFGPDRTATIDRIADELVKNRIPDLVVVQNG